MHKNDLSIRCFSRNLLKPLLFSHSPDRRLLSLYRLIVLSRSLLGYRSRTRLFSNWFIRGWLGARRLIVARIDWRVFRRAHAIGRGISGRSVICRSRGGRLLRRDSGIEAGVLGRIPRRVIAWVGVGRLGFSRWLLGMRNNILIIIIMVLF